MASEDRGRRAELVRTAEMRVTLRRLLRRTEELAAAHGLTSQRYTLPRSQGSQAR